MLYSDHTPVEQKDIKSRKMTNGDYLLTLATHQNFDFVLNPNTLVLVLSESV